ncbi:MAG: response regulator transcription factor [Planctomycetes bacterium]|nr:response regulator transcription factor [Planctomycetota bacterium]
MRILIAEDDSDFRFLLETTLRRWGFDVVSASNGQEALDALQRPDGPSLAIVDWLMPIMDGLEVCRRIRAGSAGQRPIHIILLTAMSHKEDVVRGLRAGADDYVIKPFDPGELQARIQVGARVLGLEAELAERVHDLEQALARVKQLHGLLPICSYCKKIRDDHNYWLQVEQYITSHSEAQFSHSICPDCFERHVKPELDKLNK